MFHFGNLLEEGFAVLGRDGKVQVDSVVTIAGIEGALDDVFLEGGALHSAVAVEFQQCLGQAAIAEVLLLEEEIDDGAVVASAHVVVDVEVGTFHAVLQVVVEGEGAQIFKESFYLGELLFEIFGHPEVSGGEAVKVFEHACCSSRGGDELQDFFVACKCAVLFFVAGYFLVAEAADAAVVRRCCRVEVAFGKSFLEVVYLELYALGGKTHLGELFEVLFSGFKCHGLWFLSLFSRVGFQG